MQISRQTYTVAGPPVPAAGRRAASRLRESLRPGNTEGEAQRGPGVLAAPVTGDGGKVVLSVERKLKAISHRDSAAFPLSYPFSQRPWGQLRGTRLTSRFSLRPCPWHPSAGLPVLAVIPGTCRAFSEVTWKSPGSGRTNPPCFQSTPLNRRLSLQVWQRWLCRDGGIILLLP